jgi:hypothetical protein
MARLQTNGLTIIEILNYETLKLVLRISGKDGYPWGRSMLGQVDTINLTSIPGVDFRVLHTRDSATIEAVPIGAISLRARAQILRGASIESKIEALTKKGSL